MATTSLRRSWRRLSAPWRRWRADTRGFFWLPCPVCGEPFGGFECATMLAVPNVDGTTSLACRGCEDEWTAATGSVCAEWGHVPVGICHGQPQSSDRAGVRFRFRLGGPPDEVRCQVCYARLPLADGPTD